MVTCRDEKEYGILEAALKDHEPEPYTQAGVAPVFDQIDAIRSEFPKFDLADILDCFTAFASLPKHYFLSEMRTVRKLLELLRGMDLSGVDLEELFLFLSAPVKVENEEVAATFLYVKNESIKYDSHYFSMRIILLRDCKAQFLFTFPPLTPLTAATKF